MKKLGFSIVAIMCSVVLLGGCTWFGGEPPTPPTPPTPVPTDPVKESFTNYFETSVDATYYETKQTVTDQNNEELLFTSLVDRQIDVLTQDIIYRLTAVYGAGVAQVNTGTGSYGEPALVLTDPITGTDFAVNSKKATIGNYKLIANPSTATASAATYRYASGTEVKNGASTLTSPNITELASYAYALQTGEWASGLTLTNQFNLKQALNGGYSFSGGFTNTLQTASDWNMKSSSSLLVSPDLTNATVLYEDFYMQHFATIKQAIANILAMGNSSGYSYQTAIENITKLGFSSSDKTNITNYVLNNVIGSSIVSADTAKKPSSDVITASTSLTNTEHTYKAYAVIIPSLVNQAMENTFVGTTTSLWLNVNQTDTTDSELYYTYLTNKNFTQIKITPKKTIPLTKLVIVINDVNVANLTLSYSIYRSSTSTLASNKPISKTSSKTITINFSAYASTSLTTSGYIIIGITNSTSSPFSITMDGYYDKN